MDGVKIWKIKITRPGKYYINLSQPDKRYKDAEGLYTTMIMFKKSDFTYKGGKLFIERDPFFENNFEAGEYYLVTNFPKKSNSKHTGAVATYGVAPSEISAENMNENQIWNLLHQAMRKRSQSNVGTAEWKGYQGSPVFKDIKYKLNHMNDGWGNITFRNGSSRTLHVTVDIQGQNIGKTMPEKGGDGKYKVTVGPGEFKCVFYETTG